MPSQKRVNKKKKDFEAQSTRLIRQSIIHAELQKLQGFIILTEVHHKGECCARRQEQQRDNNKILDLFAAFMHLSPSHSQCSYSREKTEVQLQNVKGKHTKTNKTLEPSSLWLYDGNGMHLSRYYAHKRHHHWLIKMSFRFKCLLKTWQSLESRHQGLKEIFREKFRQKMTFLGCLSKWRF